MTALLTGYYDALDMLPTEADCQLGFKDVKVILMTGESRTVRVNTLAPRLQSNILRRWATTLDGRLLLRPMVARENGSDNFFNSLSPVSLKLLEFTAVTLCLGPDKARELIRASALKFATENPEFN